MRHTLVLALLVSISLSMFATAIAQPAEQCLQLGAQLTAEAALNLNDITQTADPKAKCDMHKVEQSRLENVRQALRQHYPQCQELGERIAKIAAEQKQLMAKPCAR